MLRPEPPAPNTAYSRLYDYKLQVWDFHIVPTKPAWPTNFPKSFTRLGVPIMSEISPLPSLCFVLCLFMEILPRLYCFRLSLLRLSPLARSSLSFN